MGDARPHTLHLTIEADGWLTWALDCPYGDERPPGRPCSLVTDARDTGHPTDVEGWWYVPGGCFAQEWCSEVAYEDILALGITDPVFPLAVDVRVDGDYEDAVCTIVPWDVTDE